MSSMLVCPSCGNIGSCFTNNKCGLCGVDVVDTGYQLQDIWHFNYDEEKNGKKRFLKSL